MPLAHVYNYNQLIQSFETRCEIVNSNFETNIKIKYFLKILNYLTIGSHLTLESFFRSINFSAPFSKCGKTFSFHCYPRILQIAY